MAKNLMVLSGTAMWAKVFEPDTKFNPDGDYSINLQMPVAEATPMCEKLDEIVQAKFDEAIEKDPRLKNTLSKQCCSNPVYDRDTGDDTGNVEFKFKLKAKVKVAFEPVPYVMPSTKKAGVSLRLKALQVIDLVEYGNSATSVFDEEDGYVAPTNITTEAVSEEIPFDEGDF
jgi:hypothetical protein